MARSTGRLEVGVDMAGEGDLGTEALPTAIDDAEEGFGAHVVVHMVTKPGVR